MTFDWYPFYAMDFRRDTLHLTLAQDGAYRRLIDEYMLTRAPLPDSDAALARIIGASEADWLSVSQVVRSFFNASNGKLIHKRCEKELDTQRILAVSRSAHAKHAVEARWKKHNERKELIQRVYGENTPRILNDTTRQRKKEETEDRSQSISPELKVLVATKGWK